jgi:hypothetical protein
VFGDGDSETAVYHAAASLLKTVVVKCLWFPGQGFAPHILSRILAGNKVYPVSYRKIKDRHGARGLRDELWPRSG